MTVNMGLHCSHVTNAVLYVCAYVRSCVRACVRVCVCVFFTAWLIYERKRMYAYIICPLSEQKRSM